jgi:FkbM family methyltransferase
MVYCDVLIDRVYGRFEPGPPVATVLDIGANIGLTSVFFLTRFPACRLVAVEPDPANLIMCRSNLAAFGDRATVVEGALWSEDARLSVSSEHQGTWASSVAPNDRGTIEGQTMRSLLERVGGRADIVKIDVEGAELAVFEAADTSWIDAVRCIAVEPEHERSLAAFQRAIKGRRRIVCRYRDVLFAA